MNEPVEIRLMHLAGKPVLHAVLGEMPGEEDRESVAACGVRPSPSGGSYWIFAEPGEVMTCPKCRRWSADRLQEEFDLMTEADIEAALSAAPGVPMSKGRIDEIVRYATGK